ncbi:hypothetical protein GCM10023226_06510 [Nocardioides nanhaiensis]|uniref:Uncharacterized protein n=1 Tax=Nocardioides nanhaiensis TaxID=1476871 RepID=A0ABP8VTM1_9ACTN
MTRPTTRGIDFEEWGAINQREALRIARSPLQPMPYRVMFAAMSRANRVGHAEFAKGELADLLKVTRGDSPSMLTVPSRQQVWGAIRRAKNLELVEETSRLRCLILSPSLWTRGTGSGRCAEHRVGRWV